MRLTPEHNTKLRFFFFAFIAVVLGISMSVLQYRKIFQNKAAEPVSPLRQALTFTNPVVNNSYITVENLSPDFFKATVTMELWLKIKPEEAKDIYNILTYAPRDRFTSRTFNLDLSREIETMNLSFVIQKAFDDFTTITYPVPQEWIAQGQWFHVGITMDGVKANLYVNGILVGETSFASLYIAENPILTVGGIVRNGYLEGNSAMLGSVDEFRISKMVRNIPQNWIDGFYENPLNTDENTLALWHFDGNLEDANNQYDFYQTTGPIEFELGPVFITPTPSPIPTEVTPLPTEPPTSTPIPIPTIFTILKSEYLKNDLTANSIINNSTNNIVFPIYSSDDKFLAKITSSFRMLGYDYYKPIEGINLLRWANFFQTQQNLFVTNIVTREFIIALDDELYKHEQKIKKWTDIFPIDTNYRSSYGFDVVYKPLDPSEVSKDHIRYYLSYLLSQLPQELAPLTEYNMTYFFQNQAHGVIKYDPAQQKYILDYVAGEIYRPSKNIPTDLFSMPRLFHEYGHHLEGYGGIDPKKGQINFDGLFKITFDENNCTSLFFCKRKPGFKYITNYAQGVVHDGEYYSMHEMAAEAVSMYVLHAKLFRKLATIHNDYKLVYDWMKDNVFKGREYCTGSEGILKNNKGDYWDYTLPEPIPAGNTIDIMMDYKENSLITNENNPVMPIDEYLREGEYYPNCRTDPTPIVSPTSTPTPTATSTLTPTPTPRMESVSGYVWIDSNNNGRADNGEEQIKQALDIEFVYPNKSAQYSYLKAPNWMFSFQSNNYGRTEINMQLPAGYTVAPQGTDNKYTQVLSAGIPIAQVVFDLRNPAGGPAGIYEYPLGIIPIATPTPTHTPTPTLIPTRTPTPTNTPKPTQPPTPAKNSAPVIGGIKLPNPILQYRLYATSFIVTDPDRNAVTVTITGLPRAYSYVCRRVNSREDFALRCTVLGAGLTKGTFKVEIRATDSRNAVSTRKGSFTVR